MDAETRTTDSKGRVSLPKGFANSTVIIEQVSDTELRVRKARVVPEDEVRFREESPLVLSDIDRDRFLEALEHPPEPGPALLRAAARHVHGSK
ncbi:MAG: hypothetical protein KatS3mg108_2580 [Isosphaeraceae bacterium]|jgi:hypothetical protein|nr:MAG: hypothetical protein KatS3mg108_2580 [Isosphaeraceae bacterium]